MNIRNLLIKTFSFVKNFIYSKINQYLIQKKIIKTYEDNITKLILSEVYRYDIRDVINAIVKNVPRDNNVYSVSFIFVAENNTKKGLFAQVNVLSNDTKLIEKVIEAQIEIREKYEFSYLRRVETNIIKAHPKNLAFIDREYFDNMWEKGYYSKSKSHRDNRKRK